MVDLNIVNWNALSTAGTSSLQSMSSNDELIKRLLDERSKGMVFHDTGAIDPPREGGWNTAKSWNDVAVEQGRLLRITLFSPLTSYLSIPLGDTRCKMRLASSTRADFLDEDTISSYTRKWNPANMVPSGDVVHPRAVKDIWQNVYMTAILPTFGYQKYNFRLRIWNSGAAPEAVMHFDWNTQFIVEDVGPMR